jgi:hypothetical protein
LIAIDNAVELTIKTYLTLPKRVTKTGLSRKKYQEISDSFPALLDALEEHASDRLSGIDLGEIEWYHRLRNQLYHQGSGLTVEREKVEVYAEIARLLFENLFGLELAVTPTPIQGRIGRFLAAWVQVERLLQHYLARGGASYWTLAFPLQSSADVPPSLRASNSLAQLNQLREVRNHVVHQGHIPSEEEVRLIEHWSNRLRKEAADGS